MKQYLLFKLDDNRHCIDIEEVKYILKYSKPTNIPLSIPECRGVVSVKGELKTVIDLNLCLYGNEIDLTKDTENLKLLLINNSNKCFLVSDVNEIVTIDDNEIKEVTLNTVLCKMAKYKDDVFTIVNAKDVLENLEN